MKRSLLLAFFIGVFSGAFAQEFTLRYINSSASGPASTFELVTKAVLLNNSNDTVFTWVRVKEAFPNNWQSAICDAVQCWDVGIDSNRFVLKKGDSSNIDLHFYPFNTAGSGSSDVIVYPNNNRAAAKTLMFTASTWGTSTRDISNRPITDVEVFPIPASKNLTLRFADYQQTTVIVYDVLGKEVLRKEINGKEASIDISALENGIFVLRYKNVNGSYVSKKFRKASF